MRKFIFCAVIQDIGRMQHEEICSAQEEIIEKHGDR